MAFMIAVDILNWSLEAYGNSEVNEDIRLIKEHRNLFTRQVLPLVIEAIRSGLIPPEYVNMQDISAIANVVFSGESYSDNHAIKDIGISILQSVGMYKQPMKVVNAAPSSEGSDATRVVKPIMLPDYNNK